jgi:hypothetical protein
MSDQKLLQTSFSDDLAWLEEVSDVADLEGCVSEVCRKTEAIPVSDRISLHQIRYE